MKKLIKISVVAVSLSMGGYLYAQNGKPNKDADKGNKVELKVTAGDIPESITLDLSGMDIGDTANISDISLPKGTRQVGFYSYGELSPIASGRCDLHNQTMTLTGVWEI